MAEKSPYIIRAGEVAPYSPPNPTGTKTYRLIGPNERIGLLVIYSPPHGEDPAKGIKTQPAH